MVVCLEITAYGHDKGSALSHRKRHCLGQPIRLESAKEHDALVQLHIRRRFVTRHHIVAIMVSTNLRSQRKASAIHEKTWSIHVHFGGLLGN